MSTRQTLPAITTDPIALQLLTMQRDSPLLVSLFDAADVLQYANLAFRNSFGLAEDEVISWSDLMLKNHALKTGSLIKTRNIEVWLASARSRRGKLPFRAFEADLCDGRWIWMTETVRADGWMMCVACDITELKTSRRALRQERDVALRAAQTDSLTGISNRAHVISLLERSLDKLRHKGEPCGVALLDLDHFKAINDGLGHHSGDLVLRRFADAVHNILRRGDGFGRVGGEEFLVLCPDINMAGLNHLLRRVLESVRESRPLPEYPEFSYTCSGGLGMLQVDDDAISIFRRVDGALYQAKHLGRDRCVWAEEAVPEPV